MKNSILHLLLILVVPLGMYAQSSTESSLKLNTQLSAEMLDPVQYMRKVEILATHQKAMDRSQRSLTIGASIIAIMDYQSSNRDSKFGYLMRHPTSANEIGKTVSEVAIHSAQFSVIGNVNSWISFYGEALYNPEQSFGPGTTTALGRNTIHLRKGFVVLGDLNKSPFYAAIGKMDATFGQPGSVNPFTNSTNWHAFAGLGYAAQLSYHKAGLHLSAMAIQGGAQFRVLNAPVENTNVPSKLNNFALDGSYTLKFGRGSVKLGASYLHGTSYVQDFPVQHFNPGKENNPATAVYSTIQLGTFVFKGAYTTTLKVWPGTHNPNKPLDIYPASKVSSLSFGAKTDVMNRGNWKSSISFEFSNFVAGAKGSPWERQNQYVLGWSSQYKAGCRLFAELFHTQGYEPLNFVSGGHNPQNPGETWSDRDAKSYGVVVGSMVFL